MEIRLILNKFDDKWVKVLESENYNYIFDSHDGLFIRTGKTKKTEDDPQYSPYGPEILDIEISTICSGIDGTPCPWCYKSNTTKGEYMTFETFKVIFDKMAKTVTQIAFGIGDVDANPDMFKIMEYCRENHVIPNVTINGARLTNDIVNNLAKVCGAVAVSCYDKGVCYDAVKRLTDAGLKQVNIHKLLAEQTYDECLSMYDDIKTDPRLAKLNATVFLWLKPKGDRNKFTQLSSMEKYKHLVITALEREVKIGFDSCSASSFVKAIEGIEKYKHMITYVEPCESTLFSYYIDCSGRGFPCSFTEGHPDYKGIDIIKAEDFIKDVWNNEETVKFRSKCINNCRRCVAYDLEVR